MLEHIADYVSIKGNRWKRNQSIMSPALQQKVDDKPLWGQELYQHLVSSKIVLNITRGPFYAAETGVNLRIFEAMAAGCFVLTDYCDEVADLFEIGLEIETFKGSKELVEKVLYYLSNDDARLAIAKRGQQKISQHYTWKKRVEYMLSYMD
ncbi:glycosyltransferase family protein [Methylophaga sp.]